MIRFEDILDRVEAYNPQANQDLLRRAYVFSALEHKGQVRHSGEPYLIHPLEVADILADMRMVAEGVNTARSVYDLSRQLEVEMPICHQTYRILYENLPPREALYQLMTRDLKQELDED